MPIDPHHSQELIRGALLRKSGSRADAWTVAEASVAIWQRMALELVPVIGQDGMHALYRRCLNLQRIAHRETDASGPSLSTAASFVAVQLSLERHEAADALEASLALLGTFTTLLSGLIGEGLTARLLNTVWTEERSSTPIQETKP